VHVLYVKRIQILNHDLFKKHGIIFFSVDGAAEAEAIEQMDGAAVQESERSSA
jgi:hypothetical protein